MRFIFKYFEKTPLIIAIENNNIQIVQLLLECPNIDVNTKIILIL